MVNKYKKMLAGMILLGLIFSLFHPVEAAWKKTSVKISKKKLTITVGKKKQLKGKICHKKGKVKLYWKSSNKKIATVNKKGIVKGIKRGKVNISVGIKGTKKKAVCRVTVKNAVVKDKKVIRATPSPGNTAAPGRTEAPSETEKPTPTPDTGNTTPMPVTPLRKVVVDEIDGVETTVFLLDKSYQGTLHISFCGYETTQQGSVKDVLVLLKSSYMADGVAKVNKDKTISFYRGSKEENWKITELLTGITYEMWAETVNTYDTTYSNCGVIYIKGNVMEDVAVY